MGYAHLPPGGPVILPSAITEFLVKASNVSREECDGYKEGVGYLSAGFRSARKLRCRGRTMREKN